MIPPDDVFERALGNEEPEVAEPVELARSLAPLADNLRFAVAEIRETKLSEASPERRMYVANLRDLLYRIARDSATLVDAIDAGFRIAARQLGSDQVLTADGIVEIEWARPSWQVDAAGLEAAFRELVKDGLLADAEIESTFTTTVSVAANNSRLNYLERHRGERVAEIIAAHRRQVPPPEMSGKVRYSKVER